ncbi:MAG: hypothetical protein JSV43_08615 [Methanobacteriota archaeon]|nr:MAG: hypothetical protein JSV43_08615 [Euryarchaeota archaeon]
MAGKLKALSRKATTVLLALSLFMILTPLLVTEEARADPRDLLIWGMIFDSDGSVLPYDTDFRVWVQHNGTWKGFPSNDTWDTVGTMGGFYTYNLTWEEKEATWSDGDLYRIQVDCTPSGGLAENTTSNGTGSVGDPISPRGSYNNELDWGPAIFNNTQQWDVACSNVDLVPTSIEIDGIPYTPPMGVAPFAAVDISAMVTNNGITDISENNTIVLRNQSGLIGQDTAMTIAPGSSVGPYSFIWNAPDGGYFCFNITVDYYDNVTETDEINNSEMVCLSVGAPDLTPSDIQVSTDYPPHFYADASATNYRSNIISITPGTTANIVSDVRNVGSLISDMCSIDFYNTTSEGGPRVGLPFYESGVPQIPSGSQVGPYSGSWQAPLSFGNHYVNITADYYDDVVEINPLNNTFILRFLVGYPDYIPWNDTMPLVQNVTAGATVPIEVIVRNIGLLDALSDSTIAFYDDYFMGRFAARHVLPIAAGENSSQPYSVNWQAPPVLVLTSVNVTIIVDDTGNITEMDELNNATTIQFWVHPGPITTLNVRTPQYFNGTHLYIKSTTMLNFTVQTTAGPTDTVFFLDSFGPLDYALTGEFNFSEYSIGEGLHYINFSSVDSLLNVEPWKSEIVIVDDSPPLTQMDIDEPLYVFGPTMWVTSFTNIELNWTKDDEPQLAAGREVTRYRIFRHVQNWTSWADYALGTPLNLGTGDGERFVEWYSVDYLGNVDVTVNWTLIVDDTPPVITLMIDGTPYDEIEGTPHITDETQITLSAVDDGCGRKGGITYNWDGGDSQTYTGAFSFGESGEHTIFVSSEDNLDNSDTVSFEVFVVGPNYKPIIAIICIIIMVLVGILVGSKRPLLMARKKIREIEDKLLEEEEETEEEVMEPEIVDDTEVEEVV